MAILLLFFLGKSEFKNRTVSMELERYHDVLRKDIFSHKDFVQLSPNSQFFLYVEDLSCVSNINTE